MELFFLILFSLFSVLCAIAEGFLLSLSNFKTKKLLEKRADIEEIIESLNRNLNDVLCATIIINIISNVGIIYSLIFIESKFFPDFFTNIYFNVVSALTLSAVLVSVLQIVPKLIAKTKPEIVSIKLLKIIFYMSYILIIPNKVFSYLFKVFGSLFGIKDGDGEPAITEEEIKDIIEIGEEGGMVEESEREMIHGIFDLGDTMVREVMSPRVDMVCVNQKCALNEAVELIRANHHSRMPVYRENIDNIVGILFAKDILDHINKDQFSRILVKDIMRAGPKFVPETKLIIDLLHEFRKSKTHLAIAVDEYGGTSGVITIEDILEEIIGEIRDEYDTDEQELYKESDSGYIIDAKLAISELKKLFEIEEILEDEGDYDTLGGYVSAQLGKIPKVGEVFINSGLRFEVVEADEKSVRTLKVYRVYPESESQINKD